MGEFVVMVLLFWGVSAYFLFQALRTPWKPQRTDSTETKYLLSDSSRPWGRARFLLFSIAMGLLGLYILAIDYEWL
jgi:hypothetical protein